MGLELAHGLLSALHAEDSPRLTAEGLQRAGGGVGTRVSTLSATAADLVGVTRQSRNRVHPIGQRVIIR
jgi:hypothetical protein